MALMFVLFVALFVVLFLFVLPILFSLQAVGSLFVYPRQLKAVLGNRILRRNHALALQLTQGPQGEDGVEVCSFVGPVVGVGPGEVRGAGRDLAVRAIA